MTCEEIDDAASLNVKQIIERLALHMNDLLNRIDGIRDEVIKRDRRIEQLERENAELRANAVEVN